MILCKVIGNIVMTEKTSVLVGEKIMIILRLSTTMKVLGLPFLAIDRIQSGIGDKVLVIMEGSSARQIFYKDYKLFLKNNIEKNIPIRSIIVAIVDNINIS
jgi:microcompartment protein CcmK/EutM